MYVKYRNKIDGPGFALMSLLLGKTATAVRSHSRELYDLTVDPFEERNLAHPSHADDRSRALQDRMLKLLIEQLDAKRLTPSAGEVPGYRPPAMP